MERSVRNRKIIIYGLMMLLVVFVLACCTNGNSGVDVTPEPGKVTDTVTTSPTPTATPAPTATPTPTPSPTPTPIPRVQDTFEPTDDDGVYVKSAAFTGVNVSDPYYVGGRLIISNNVYEDYDDFPEMEGDYPDYPEDAEYDGDAGDYGDGDPDGAFGDGLEEGEWYGDGYDDSAENLYLYSVDPATWDTVSATISGLGFYSAVIHPINDNLFALWGFSESEIRYYDKMLNPVKTVSFDEVNQAMSFEFSSDGNRIWYIFGNSLYYYDVELKQAVEVEIPDRLVVSYIRGKSGTDVLDLVVSDKSYDNYYNLYYNTATGECLGKTGVEIVYEYSPDMTRAIRSSDGENCSIEIFECAEDMYFPGEATTDPETGDEIPSSIEAVCRIQIENIGEPGFFLVDWERDLLITDIYYSSMSGGVYEFNCYSMITGKKVSNYVIRGLGNRSLYYTFDPDSGLYFSDICDDENNANITAWDYSTDTVREYPDAFPKYTEIPAKVEEKRRELEEKYGFYFYLGSEVFAKDFDYDLTIFTDYDVVYEQMEVIDEVLSIYPEGFFEQFKFGGIKNLSIYLCGGFTKRAGDSNTIEDAIALACVFGYERALALDLNWSYCLKRTIVHELSHWIDGRINSGGMLGGYADFEDDWLEHNPSDFTYKYSYVSGRTNWKYIYDSSGNNENTYFIDSYSQTYPTEDRARLFEYLMYNDNEDYSDYLALPHLQDKLKFFFEAIRKGFDTSTWPEKTIWEEKLDEKIKAREEAENATETGEPQPEE